MFRIVEDAMPPLPERCSPPLADLLKQCFAKDPLSRPTALELQSHIWLAKNWDVHKVSLVGLIESKRARTKFVIAHCRICDCRTVYLFSNASTCLVPTPLRLSPLPHPCCRFPPFSSTTRSTLRVILRVVTQSQLTGSTHSSRVASAKVRICGALPRACVALLTLFFSGDSGRVQAMWRVCTPTCSTLRTLWSYQPQNVCLSRSIALRHSSTAARLLAQHARYAPTILDLFTSFPGNITH